MTALSETSQPATRVISLLPAATEIVASLDKLDVLVGISHECDFPPEVNARPRVTQCEIHGSGLPSEDIDRWVTEKLAGDGTLYTLEEELVRELRPDAILTQKLCDVCAVNFESVARFAAHLPGSPTVVNLEPGTLEDIFGDIRSVAKVLGVEDRAEKVVQGLSARVESVRKLAATVPKKRCVLLEWVHPPFCTGHWGPELVDLAGGYDPLGRLGEDSARIEWDAVIAAAPEVLVFACCGYNIDRTREDVRMLQSIRGWSTMPATQTGEVYVCDGSAYFARPGPRVVDSLEILAEILHPELFRGRFPARPFERLATGKGNELRRAHG